MVRAARGLSACPGLNTIMQYSLPFAYYWYLALSMPSTTTTTSYTTSTTTTTTTTTTTITDIAAAVAGDRELVYIGLRRGFASLFFCVVFCVVPFHVGWRPVVHGRAPTCNGPWHLGALSCVV